MIIDHVHPSCGWSAEGFERQDSWFKKQSLQWLADTISVVAGSDEKTTWLCQTELGFFWPELEIWFLFLTRFKSVCSSY